MAISAYPVYCLERSKIPLEIRLDLATKALQGEGHHDGAVYENCIVDATLGRANPKPVYIQIQRVDGDESTKPAADGTSWYYITEAWLDVLETEDRAANGGGRAGDEKARA